MCGSATPQVSEREGWIDSFPGLRAPTAALPGAIICDLYEVGKAPNGAFGGKFRKNIFTNL